MMDRRTVISLVTIGALWPSQALGQVAAADGKAHRLAVISPSRYSADEIRAVVLPELARLGFVDGRNLAVSFHVGALGDLYELARQALATRPDLVIASTIAATQAILAQAPATPIIVAFGGDLVAAGLATSHARPGGTVSGLSLIPGVLDIKRLSLLHEAVPKAGRIGVLISRTQLSGDERPEISQAATALGLEAHVVFTAGQTDYTTAFGEMRAAGVAALLVASSPEHTRDTTIIAGHAIEARLPTMGGSALMGRGGCLLGYGPHNIKFRKRAADFVARILHGARVGDLPIEQPVEFELVVNLKSARALGLTIPPSILIRADEVIE